jgi:hypothetical protein
MKIKSAIFLFTTVAIVCCRSYGQSNGFENIATKVKTNEFKTVFVTNWISAPANYRMVNDKTYNPNASSLWIDVVTKTTENGSHLKVTSIGKRSIGCEVFQTIYDDGGTYGVYHSIGERYVKSIVIYNHPAKDMMTTETIITEEGKTPTTRPFLAMRVENWSTNNISLEAYDCGLPCTNKIPVVRKVKEKNNP